MDVSGSQVLEVNDERRAVGPMGYTFADAAECPNAVQAARSDHDEVDLTRAIAQCAPRGSSIPFEQGACSLARHHSREAAAAAPSERNQSGVVLGAHVSQCLMKRFEAAVSSVDTYDSPIEYGHGSIIAGLALAVDPGGHGTAYVPSTSRGRRRWVAGAIAGERDAVSKLLHGSDRNSLTTPLAGRPGAPIAGSEVDDGVGSVGCPSFRDVALANVLFREFRLLCVDMCCAV
jgi:hypothetical protein